MKAYTLPVGIALCAATSAPAQLKPEVQTGSLIPVAPKALDSKNAGLVRKGFAQCVYRRAPLKAVALLNHSDVLTVDIPAAGIKNVSDELGMAKCLGDQARFDENALEMKFPPSTLRDLLAEEVYLAKNRAAPQVPVDAKPITFSPVSIREQLGDAQAMTEFSDCAVRNDAAAADALLRTMPGSDREHAAAAMLAPALGKCLVAGQKVSLKPNNIRAFIAYAMWSRFAREATSQ